LTTTYIKEFRRKRREGGRKENRGRISGRRSTASAGERKLAWANALEGLKKSEVAWRLNARGGKEAEGKGSVHFQSFTCMEARCRESMMKKNYRSGENRQVKEAIWGKMEE